ncbi:MAG: L-lysine 2,3-aminomutase [Planctomycetes bacterium ADurb.Bin401]|nr:MAG: L-lysine 2,3-aminomutase [Planctomycetes bacterium ADurb.Bin401]
MLNDADSPITSAESQDDEPPGRPSPASALSNSTKPENKSPAEPADWKWQIANRLRSAQALSQFLGKKVPPNIEKVIEKFPMAITPYYASLIRKPDTSDPVFAMAVPQPRELIDPLFLCDDPLSEDEDMPVPGMVHRYRDRVLLIATTMCSMYCRHCTRKRIAGARESSITAQRIRQVTEYLNAHPEVSDVIVSGGDPLTMSDGSIEMVLQSLRSVPTVQVIRIGTRVPVVLPMRITDDLLNMLRKYHPLWINTHFNHPNEITPQAKEACAKLADAGIPLGNQTVLLAGVNDDAGIIEQLCKGLIQMRVRPYYLYQCDLVRGVEHFRTSVRKGIEIMEYLRGRVSGIAIPTFVVDAPHGGGKIPVLPNYIVSMSPSHTVLRNYQGMMVNYPEPCIQQIPPNIQPAEQTGVWELASGKTSFVSPARHHRIKRTANTASDKKTSYLFEL